MSLKPIVSIIVAVLNASKNLDRCIQTVVNQKYPNKEIIIIDGGSIDGSLDIIEKYRKHLTYWISEKDSGISDAFNKGIRASNGDYLFFLGADDYFCNENVIYKMMLDVDPKKDLLVCGKINRLSNSGEKVLWVSKKYSSKFSLLFRMSLPHQGLFTHKLFFQKYGLFRNDLKYSMDYDLLLRAYKDFPKVIFKNIKVANWREGGVGTNCTWDIFSEYHKIKSENKVAPPIILNFLNFWTCLKYRIKSNFL